MAKPGIPKGTRDFSPSEVAKRQYIIGAIKHHFESFGFQPIETPSFENSETLMGKYGEEGDRLIFKVLDSGEFITKTIGRLQEAGPLIVNFFHLLDGLKMTIKEGKTNEYDERVNDGIKLFFEQTFGKEIISNFFISQKDIIISFYSSEQQDGATAFFRQQVFIPFYEIYNKHLLNSKKLAREISEKALRYDLTVPFARYVVQHQNDIEFPFKRYQIQPVWRADRPQKGRYREFFQCDADVVGSTSLWQEVELVQLYDAVFTTLGLNGATIKINNRKVLSGIAEVIGAKDKLIDFTVALDKLDKIGEDGVKKEMLEKGLTAEAIEKVQPLFNFTGSIDEKLQKLSQLLATSAEGTKGVEELRFICNSVAELGLGKSILDLDVTLARGLNYYTGAIFEVSAPKEVALGSIGGGGRYDDLTGIFGLKNMSGVGISFGLDRIYLVLEELGLFPETVTESTKVLFINFGEKEALYALKAIKQLRQKGHKAELYPDNAKIGKQFTHADKRGVPFAVLTGDAEIAANTYTLKNLLTGEQESVTLEGLAGKLQ